MHDKTFELELCCEYYTRWHQVRLIHFYFHKHMHVSKCKTQDIFTGNFNDDLIKATTDGDVEKLKNSLEQGADLDIRDDLNRTPLMIAANLGHVEVVQFLVEKGANHSDPNENLKAFALIGDLEKIKRSLEDGAEIDSRDRLGLTPLMHAATKGRLEAIHLLLEVK